MQTQSENSELQLKKAHGVKKEFERELLSKSNVTGVGVGYKIINGKITDQVCVRVYVKKKLPKEALDPGDMIPKTIDDVLLDVIEADFVIHLDPTRPEDHQLPFNVLLGGISVGNYTSRGSGTLGGSVFDNILGEDMILSNWHVLCGSSACIPGEVIIQPGRVAGGTGELADVVGRFHRFALTDEVDAAIARLTGDRFLLKKIFGLGAFSEIAAPRLGMRVRKSGRTTALTSGMINDESATVTVAYPDGNREFRNQIVIESGSSVSERGDSGSIWLDDSNRAVGLSFAGEGRAIANPMNAVLAALNINLRVGITMHDFVAITSNTLLF